MRLTEMQELLDGCRQFIVILCNEFELEYPQELFAEIAVALGETDD